MELCYTVILNWCRWQWFVCIQVQLSYSALQSNTFWTSSNLTTQNCTTGFILFRSLTRSSHDLQGFTQGRDATLDNCTAPGLSPVIVQYCTYIILWNEGCWLHPCLDQCSHLLRSSWALTGKIPNTAMLHVWKPVLYYTIPTHKNDSDDDDYDDSDDDNWISFLQRA